MSLNNSMCAALTLPVVKLCDHAPSALQSQPEIGGHVFPGHTQLLAKYEIWVPCPRVLNARLNFALSRRGTWATPAATACAAQRSRAARAPLARSVISESAGASLRGARRASTRLRRRRRGESNLCEQNQADGKPASVTARVHGQIEVSRRQPQPQPCGS